MQLNYIRFFSYWITICLAGILYRHISPSFAKTIGNLPVYEGE